MTGRTESSESFSSIAFDPRTRYPTSRKKRGGCSGFIAGPNLDAAKAVVGLRPSFSSHVRFGERGAPVDSLRTRMGHRLIRLAALERTDEFASVCPARCLQCYRAEALEASMARLNSRSAAWRCSSALAPWP